MLQDARASASDPAVICSFDYEAIDKPTRAIIHQAARFLYVKRGRGKLVIDGEEYVLQPNTLVAITPWKITDTVEVTETLQFIKVIYDYSYLNSVFKSVLGSGDASAEPLRFLTVEPVAYLDSIQAEYVDGIMADIHWLGFDWKGGLFFASEYYDKCYEIAVDWIKRGLAYVCELSPEQVREYRGTLTKPGKNSPYRDRPVEESLRLFEEMKAGKHPEGSMILRMKIDMASPNINMRDPAMYRILYKEHHRTGKKWCIYPMYDFAHPIGDALEGITHSLCSLEYEDHRPLYDWVVEHAQNMLPGHPRQIEFSRLNLTQTIMSKRYLRMLVEKGYVSGWDDPRMPTLCGLRRRGYTAAAIRSFCERIGVAKSPNTIEYGFLEHCLREDLNAHAERTMAVLHPVKLTVTNYPEGKSEVFTVENNPTDPAQGTHEITFSRHLWIEAEDFMEVPVPKYKRLTPNGPECRLKGAYLVQCTGCVKDADGNVTEVLCTYDPESSGGDPADGRKVKGATLHWVDAENCMDAEVRLYDNLFSDEQPDGPDKDFLDCLNPESLTVLTGCKVEPEMRKVAEAFDKQADRTGVNAPTFQFMRVGYFCLDNRDSSAAHMVFNRSVSLKDSFKK